MRNQSESVWHSVVVGALLGTSSLAGCTDETADDAAEGPAGAAPESSGATTSVDESRSLTTTASLAVDTESTGAGASVVVDTSGSNSGAASGVLSENHGLDSGDASRSAHGTDTNTAFDSTQVGPAGSVTDGDVGLPACPFRLIEVFTWHEDDCSDEGFDCQVSMKCTGGEQALLMTCKDGTWQQGPRGCDHPFEFCHDAAFDGVGGAFADPPVVCEDGAWVVEGWTVGLADGLGDCPAEPPAEGGDCYGGGTGGGDPEYCGYPCPGDAEDWRIANCVLLGGTTPLEPGGFWTYDHPCE